MGWASRNLGLFYNPVCILYKDPGLKQTNLQILINVPIPTTQCLSCIQGSMTGVHDGGRAYSNAPNSWGVYRKIEYGLGS